MSALFNLKWLGSAALALGISTVALWPEMASANIVFDFSGLCDFPNSGCPTASDTATGVLTLTDGYVYGTEITSAVFVSFSYTSNLTFAPIASDNLRTVFGILNSDGSSGGNFAVQAISGRFLAFAQTWAAEDDSQQNANAGFTFGFTNVTPPPVPEPSTWAMMLIGFAGLGYAGHRASRKSAALAA